MARGKLSKLEDLAGQPDPRAPLDGVAFLAAAQPVMKGLTEDLTARAKGSAAVTEALRKRWSTEKQKQRTADGFGAWQERLCEQVAAAWLLSCVFVRTLEDRGLLGRARIAGEGAADGQRVFFELAPSLTERDYLLMVFRELSRLGAAAGLFDARHNPVWMLAPSAEGAKRLLGLFRTPSVEAPAFRFGQEDTRFLGDLYQDLDEGVRKRFALLQTPRFVEGFILDRTLEVALEKYGVGDVEVIDPTCGSGHFLLGSFERLFERRLRAEPGIEVREAASKALGAVYGADVNPYAVAIARFRLVLAFVEKGGWRRIAEVPRVEVNVVVADSLLHGSAGPGGQVGFGEMEGQSAEVWRGEEFALEDEEAAKKVLGRRYAAVVGNPPYITVSDAVLNERYRQIYPRSAFRKYSVAAPFTERFFQLARVVGRVGMITANSFMKREFGKKLIEEFLPSVNLDAVMNTSGAYIPGHGTPTVLLFGSNEAPEGNEVLTILANRGEPSTPENPERGLVWSSIAEHWNDVGFENEYISVTRTERQDLRQHPWSLTGGGAAELKLIIEERATATLGDQAVSIGVDTISRASDLIELPLKTYMRLAVEPECLLRQQIGEEIRDWSAEADAWIPVPYDRATWDLLAIDRFPGLLRFLWPHRSWLARRWVSGGTRMSDVGLPFWALPQLPVDKHKTPLSIAFAFVATHNHFVLDRGGKVFKQSAPIIKLPETATEDDHLALLAYLNSSTACFWMKQVFFDKGASIDKNFEAAKTAYEFASTQLGELPLAALSDTQRAAMVTLARELGELASTRAQLLERCLPADAVDLDQEAWSDRTERARSEDAAILERMIFLQEEVDWLTYEIWGLAPPTTKVDVTHPAREERLPLGARVPEVFAARRGEEVGIDGQRLLDKLPSRVPVRVQALVESRLRLVSTSAQLRLLETPMYKRRWLIPRVELGGGRVETFEDRLHSYCLTWLSDRVEQLVMGAHGAVCSRRDVLARARADTTLMVISESLRPGSGEAAVVSVLDENAVPYLAVQRHTERGLTKHATWQETWQAQRREDLDEHGAEPTVPPKYTAPDFRSPRFYQLRGPLDVPKERFISYPHCESTESPSPLYGWAGWNHEQRARALATLYWSRKTGEGWLVPKPDDPPDTPDLTPMLAGLLELLPWLHQWHSAPSDDYGGDSPASYFSAFLESQCQELGLTHDDLRAWRPPAKSRGRTKASKTPKALKAKADKPKRTKKAKPESEAPAFDAPERAPAPRKPKRSKKAAAPAEPAPAPVADEPTPAKPEPFALTPPSVPNDDGWKSTKKTSKKSSRRRPPSEPA